MMRDAGGRVFSVHFYHHPYLAIHTSGNSLPLPQLTTLLLIVPAPMSMKTALEWKQPMLALVEWRIGSVSIALADVPTSSCMLQILSIVQIVSNDEKKKNDDVIIVAPISHRIRCSFV
jgi:hypothetical protein